MILEALVAGGGTFSMLALTAYAVHRPERRERRECERLHRLAELEREAFGEVRSPEVIEHLATCERGRPVAAVDIYRNGTLAARAGEPFTIRAEDVRHLRELVAECEAIKRAIQDVEDFRVTAKPSPLIVTGIDPRATREKERLDELRAMLQVKREAIAAMTRAWESDPQDGPGATRVC